MYFLNFLVMETLRVYSLDKFCIQCKVMLIIFIMLYRISSQFSSVQSLSHVRLFAMTPWTAARQAFLSITSSQSLRKPMSIELVMPFNHLTLCRPLLLSPSIFPSIRGFPNESIL